MTTGHVSLQPWTTQDLLRDFDKFVQAAFDITKILAEQSSPSGTVSNLVSRSENTHDFCICI